MTVRVDSETTTQRVERCDQEGTTEALDGSSAISFCTECGKTWPSRMSAGALTVRVVVK